MARVILVSPPYVPKYMRNARCDFVSLSNSSWFPIWLGQAGAYLESLGHETKLLDAQVLGLNQDQCIEEIQKFSPDWVILYSGRLSEDSDLCFSESLKTPFVFVGPYASIDPATLIKKSSHLKYVIQREMELPLAELIAGQAPETIANLVYRDGAEIKINPLRPLYDQAILDTFPITSKYFHEQLDIRRYKTPSELYPFIDVMSGRGCAWGRCNFCLWVQTFVQGSVYKQRSLDHFMQEFEYISKNMPEVKSVMIQDDMITDKRAREISEAIIKKEIKINWSCYAKPNSNLTRETLQLMAKSGCLNLHVGFESGDEDVLKNIDKGSTVAQAIEFAQNAHAAGLNIHGDFALGHFGETKESVEKTIRLAEEINPHTAQFQVMIPFKNTKFWKQLEDNKCLGPNNEPSYEAIGGLSSEEIRSLAKKAYRRFYISPSYFKKIVSDPKNYFFNRFDQYIQAIPALFWRRWVK